MTRSWNKILVLEQLKRDFPEPKRQRIGETPLELPEVFMEVTRSFTLFQEVAHSFLPITSHQKRYTYVQYSTVLFKFTLKLLVMLFVYLHFCVLFTL